VVRNTGEGEGEAGAEAGRRAPRPYPPFSTFLLAWPRFFAASTSPLPPHSPPPKVKIVMRHHEDNKNYAAATKVARRHVLRQLGYKGIFRLKIVENKMASFKLKNITVQKTYCIFIWVLLRAS
jgi:hypothetical protein